MSNGELVISAKAVAGDVITCTFAWGTYALRVVDAVRPGRPVVYGGWIDFETNTCRPTAPFPSDIELRVLATRGDYAATEDIWSGPGVTSALDR